nr:MAG TPA: hypothetical protein [Caudoviricetes sp.]
MRVKCKDTGPCERKIKTPEWCKHSGGPNPFPQHNHDETQKETTNER